MDINDFTTNVGVSLKPAIAGLAGGLVRVVFMGEKDWKRAIGLLSVGALTAGYGTPLAMLALPGSTGGPVEGAVSFVIGILSMTLVELLLRFADWLKEDPGRILDLIRRRPPTNGGQP